MKDKDKKEKLRMLYELKDLVKSRIMFVKNSGLPEIEVTVAARENEVLMRNIDKLINTKLNPVQEIETFKGTKYKIGDQFCINGNGDSKYVIEYFPDQSTVRGHANNPAIGKPWIVDAFVEDIFKPSKTKEVPVKETKQPKPVDIKAGDYFAIRSNNTVYKATKVKKKKVFGESNLKAKDAPKLIKVNIDKVILKKKKDYKKQLKAEKNYVEPTKSKRIK